MFMDYIKQVLGITALEAEVADLKAQVADLKAPKNSLKMVSPNGTRVIEFLVTDNNAGMWMTAGPGKPQVAIYNDVNQGAVVGIWGQADTDGRRRGALDVALSHCFTTGGSIQLIDPENNMFNISPKSPFIGEGTSLSGSRSKF
jgi:hypothetical protein